jgi:hypothetical protein
MRGFAESESSEAVRELTAHTDRRVVSINHDNANTLQMRLGENDVHRL